VQYPVIPGAASLARYLTLGRPLLAEDHQDVAGSNRRANRARARECVYSFFQTSFPWLRIISMSKKLLIVALAALVFWSGLVTTASAAVITVTDARILQTREGRISEVQAVLARTEVQQAMIDMGVDPAQAQLRVASLSESELSQLQGQLDTLPAGGILGLIGAVFVILLILELTGAVDIFKKV
jgi:hypothetical protein